MAARRGNVGDPTTRNALLDAAQELMLDEGYAAVTTRRIATKAGVNSALVYYYFDSLDGLFIALVQRGAEHSMRRLTQALASEQPLWAMWDLIHDPSGSAMTMELMALANHRKAISTELAKHAQAYRRAQIERLSGVLERYGLDLAQWPPAAVIVSMFGISMLLSLEEAMGLDVGHAETEALVEEQIRALEGDRAPRRRPAKAS